MKQRKLKPIFQNLFHNLLPYVKPYKGMILGTLLPPSWALCRPGEPVDRERNGHPCGEPADSPTR